MREINEIISKYFRNLLTRDIHLVNHVVVVVVVLSVVAAAVNTFCFQSSVADLGWLAYSQAASWRAHSQAGSRRVYSQLRRRMVGALSPRAQALPPCSTENLKGTPFNIS